MKRPSIAAVILAGSLLLAGGSGFLVSTALGIGTQAPTQTTTINAGEGATGPTGPSGPAGATGPTGPAGAGAESCPTGSTFKAVRINHPGGHVTIWTCVENE